MGGGRLAGEAARGECFRLPNRLHKDKLGWSLGNMMQPVLVGQPSGAETFHGWRDGERGSTLRSLSASVPQHNHPSLKAPSHPAPGTNEWTNPSPCPSPREVSRGEGDLPTRLDQPEHTILRPADNVSPSPREESSGGGACGGGIICWT